jgi:hypothetical protein
MDTAKSGKWALSLERPLSGIRPPFIAKAGSGLWPVPD